jgi:hypothetical protein
LSTNNTQDDRAGPGLFFQQRRTERHHVIVTLNNEQLAAVEGWRLAHGIAEQSDALGELVRLGLLSEIAKIFRLVSENRAPTAERPRAGAERKSRKSERMDS